MSHSVLVIEDEVILSKSIKMYLEKRGYDVQTAAEGKQGLAVFETMKPDLVLLDVQLPDANGLEILQEMRQREPQTKVILITGSGNVQLAVQAMKGGAYDYLSKPLVLSELKVLLDKAVEHSRLEGVVSYYQSKEASESALANLLGESPPMLALKAQIQQLLRAEQALTGGDLPAVLITGETGAGKELVARSLHYNGCRKDRPLIELNCASIPAQLLEAELFGYEQGAFTDAKGRKVGLFEAAEGGTLFLDEIGDMDLALQAKLLKVLEDKRIRRLGGLRDRKIDVRIVAATNQTLEQSVKQGTFRADLYFRLRVIPLIVPPLRERSSDILLLANHFIEEHCRRYGKERLRLSAAAEHILLHYSWPGNVRELRNIMEQAVLLAQPEEIEPAQLLLPWGFPGATSKDDGGGIRLPEAGLSLEDVERDLVQQALDRTTGNITRAARLLGLSRDTLRYRLEKYKINF